jgi:Domain of unknown function (DUF4328)
LVLLAHLALLIGTGVVFFIWLYRSYANLKLLGARGLSYSPGWAVGYYFVPIMSLFRPYQVMQEIWKGSDPAFATEGARGWRDAPSSAFVMPWWGFWLTANFAWQISIGNGSAPKPDIGNLKVGAWLGVIADVAAVAAGTCLIFLIHSITNRQEKKHKRWRKFQARVDDELEGSVD